MSGEAFGPGLSSYLTEMWETEVDVEVVTQATTGARRANVLFDAVTAERQREVFPLVRDNGQQNVRARLKDGYPQPAQHSALRISQSLPAAPTQLLPSCMFIK